MKARNILSFVFTLVLCVSSSAQMFTEEQVERGLVHEFYHANFNGGGIAFVDLDNDGDDDVYLTGGKESDKILINDGNGYFTDITSTTGISMTDSIYTAGVIYGDVDNDGDQDLFVNTHFSDNVSPWTKNLLFLNNGDMTFTETWSPDTDKSMTMGSVFIDYDLDGDLDIYNVAYVENVKFTFDENNAVNGFDHDCFKNHMYRNNGDGSFTDVTDNLGLGDTGCALAVTATDFDLDGDMDILIGNDFGPFIEPNKLYRNDREQGVFTEVGMEVNCADEMFSMGIAIGDYDNDLDLDYYISNLSSNVMLEYEDGSFTDVAEVTNTANMLVEKDSTLSISWGTLFMDVNNDMYVDLFISNGYVPAPAFVDNGNLEPDRLYLNNGDKTFTAIDSADGIYNEVASRGCAYSDVDNDGKLDIYSVVYDKPTFGLDGGSCLFMNNSTNENNWVKIKLEGTQTNRNAFGSKVYIYTGNEIQMRELSGGASFCSHSTSTMHIGIGEYTSVDSVKIAWTGGNHIQTETNIVVNALNNIKEDFVFTSTNSLQSNTVKVYPNPTQDILYIKGENVTSVEIYNNLSQKMAQAYGDQINVSDLIPGQYRLRITIGNKTVQSTFVKN